MNKKNVIRGCGAMLMIMCMMLSLMPTTFFADRTAREIPEDAIYISTPEELVELAENCQVNTWSVDKTVVLTSDIDMSNEEFYGIPTFGGIFIGKGFTIKGINIESEGSIVGFFRYLQETAVVENLNIEGIYLPTGSRSVVGAIAGKNAGVIENCTFKGNVSGNEQIGGLVGVNETTGLIDGCAIAGLVYGNHFVGGAAGENHGVIRNTTNNASINTSSVQNSVELEDITMDSLVNTENASTTTDIGGIAGANSGVIRACTNNGVVGYQHMGYNIGGIVGTQNGYVVDCVNNADIQGRKEVGGIVGHMEPNIVLDYDTDSIQMISSQMNQMEATIGNVERMLENGGEDSANQLSGLEDEMQNLDNALDALNGSMDLENGEVDQDRVDAAMNDLSDSFGDVYSESAKIQEFNLSTMADVAGQMGDLMSQMEQLMVTMGNVDENLGMSLEDISDKDTPEDTLGKVANCINYGKVSGDLNVGGIAGVVAEENDLDVYQDTEVTGDVSLNATYETRAVIRGCVNHATIFINKQNGGGIAGSMIMGAVLECTNFGNLDALNADYVGGIVGDSATIIRNCSSKAVIAGDTYVGGIAGDGKEVTDCYAFVQIAAATEKAGAIIGYTENLPDGTEDTILRNQYFLDGKNVGGIDGISYTGAADVLSLEDFLAIPNLNEAFKTVNVTFREEGQVDVVKTINVGESLSLDMVPSPAVEDDEEYDWEFVPAVTWEALGMGELASVTYISEESLSNILFDQTYEVTFDTKGSVINSEERTEKGLPVFLAVGSFAKNTKLEVSNQMTSEAVIDEKELLVNYQITLSNVGVEKLHYYLGETVNGNAVKLLVKDNSGNWTEREFIVDGSYMVFSFTETDTAFALVEDASAMMGQIAIVAVVVVLLAVVLLLGKRRKNKK